MALCLSLLLSAVAMSQEGLGPQLRLLGLPQVEGDQVALRFSVRSAQGLPVTSLSAANVRLDESAQDIRLESRAELAQSLALIVSTSAASDLDLIRESLRVALDGLYREGDELSFFISAQRSVQQRRAASRAEADAIVAGLSESPSYDDSTPALLAALDWLSERRSDDQAVQALFVASYLNRSEEAQLGERYAQASQPLHVVQAHRFRQDSTPSLRVLASSSGGLFANNREGRFVVRDQGAPQAVNTFKVLLDTMRGARLVYELSYRSANRSLAAERRVTLRLALSSDQVAEAVFSYERPFDPPSLELVAPSLAANRQPTRRGAAIIYDLDEAPIVVRVRFGDDLPRALRSLRLEVTDGTGRVLQSDLLSDPQPNSAGHYALPWSLTPFSTPNSSSEVRVVVRVTDELGLESELTTTGRVSVGNLPPLPSPTPTLTPVPTATPTPQAAAALVVGLMDDGSGIPISPQQLLGGFVALLLVAVVALIMLLLTLSRLRRLRRRAARELAEAQAMTSFQGGQASQAPPNSADAGPGAVVAHVGGASPSPNGASAPSEAEKPLLGRLIVLEGLKEREIAIYEPVFIIGRSAEQGCHLVIDEPFISPRHCAIHIKDGVFAVRDLGGKNGTFVNGERVPRDRETFVPIGSEVAISKAVVVELWDADTYIDLSTRHESRGSITRTQARSDELTFRPMLDIAYAGDDDAIDDHYSPL
jgi:hypothetical protein